MTTFIMQIFIENKNMTERQNPLNRQMSQSRGQDSHRWEQGQGQEFRSSDGSD